MENRRRSGFGSFLKFIIMLALLSAVGFVGYKTYQKLPVVTFVNELAQAADELDMDKLSNCFTPDSDVRKALEVANTIEGIPILGKLAEGAVSFIGSRFDYQVDYSDIRITVNGDTSAAIIGVIDKNKNDRKSYVTLNLIRIDNRWYITELPAVQPVTEVDLSYGNTLWGYAERASDYTALLIFSAKNKA